ncbi:hypothetical protein QYF61_017477 [Mycteria americana]|uniref:Uncharacterized protein n=1 Tax=Mycteria americana TaxID=33587 RepID=A0AAN7SIE7_MYCAM|nr:hypothetical protein QYF61_017477 [Mycteria americana]
MLPEKPNPEPKQNMRCFAVAPHLEAPMSHRLSCITTSWISTFTLIEQLCREVDTIWLKLIPNKTGADVEPPLERPLSPANLVTEQRMARTKSVLRLTEGRRQALDTVRVCNPMGSQPWHLMPLAQTNRLHPQVLRELADVLPGYSRSSLRGHANERSS